MEDFKPIEGLFVWTIVQNGLQRQLVTVSDDVRDWDGTVSRIALRSEAAYSVTGGDYYANVLSLKITGRRLLLAGSSYDLQEVRCRVVFEDDENRESCAAYLRCARGVSLDELKKIIAEAQGFGSGGR